MLIYRRLPFQYLKNARDLGGHPTRDGGCTAWNVFVRAELPRQLGTEDLSLLRGLGLTDAIDLRGAREVENTPSALAGLEGVAYHHCPLFDARAAAVATGADGAARKNSPAVAWAAAYIEMAETQKPWVQNTLSIAAEASGCSLYHCTTGKDRTGLLTALLLGLAGVDDRDIIADYCVSQVYMAPVYLEMQKFFPFKTPDGGLDLTNPFFKTSPDNMEGLLDHLNRAYGGVEAYVRACGTQAGTIDRIRAKLKMH